MFGNPLPGQAVTNALSVSGFDIFAWNDPPTLARYLAAGPAGLLEMRVDGHQPQPVQRPAAARRPGLAHRPARAAVAGPRRALRPVLLDGLLTFLATSLLFPVATTWGTFLHAAAGHVLLLIVPRSARSTPGIARLGRRLRLDAARRVARARARDLRSALFSVASCRASAAAPRDGRTYACWPRRWRPSARRSTAAHP